MEIAFTTTITHTITIGNDGELSADHAITIDSTPIASGLPKVVLLSTVLGGLRSAEAAVEDLLPSQKEGE